MRLVLLVLGWYGMAEDGCVLCWGSGQHGQHGHGPVKHTITLNLNTAPLESVLPCVDYNLACGASHTVCVSRGLYLWLI